MSYRSAFLIANQISIEETLPFKLSSSVMLRRPSDIELKAIKDALRYSSSFDGARSYYECEYSDTSETSTESIYIELPQEWHYYVLSDDDGGSSVNDLEPFLALVTPSLDLSVRVNVRIDESTGQELMSGWGPPGPHVNERFYYGLSKPVRTIIKLEEFAQAEYFRKTISNLNSSFAFIRSSAKLMSDVRKVSNMSHLYSLGLFAVIEGLIVHKPRQAESLDSISHQFQGKLNLLVNHLRLDDMLKYYFTDSSVEWKKLYEYRSSIAHGLQVDIKKQLQSLKDPEALMLFLEDLSRRLVASAIDEPQFFYDLKQC